MAQGIVIDVGARVTGYQASLRQLEQALQHIDAGSAIGSQLASAFEDANKRVKELGRNLSQRAASDGQIDSIVDKVNGAGDAIQKVINLMGGLTGKDLNLSSFGNEVGQIIEQINTLKTEMGSAFNDNFANFLKAPTDEAGKLRQAFLDLGFKIKDISGDNALNILTQGLKDAQAEADKAAKALDQINEKLKKQQDAYQNKYGNNPFANKNFNETDFATRLSAIKTPEKIIDPNKVKAMQDQMLNGLLNFNLNGKDDIAINLLDELFRGLTPDNIRGRINNFVTQISAQLRIGKDAIRAQLLNGGTDKQFADALLGIDDQQLEAAKTSLLNQVKEIADGLKPEQLATIRSLIDQGEIDKAKNTTLVAMRAAYEELKRRMENDNKELENLTKEQQNAVTRNAEAQAKVSSIDEGKKVYDAQIKVLQDTVAKQQAKIDSLQKQLDEILNAKARDLQTDAGTAGPSVYKITSEEAAKYKAQLDQVHAAEQMVGKIQGVVERWFSIYTAVRMVGNAIKSVISTINDLDKTITEIAIVTDMTQSDLWGQMDTYTAMARQYGTSISGVYKVSQLYYQQGLQTTEVMKLTEQTLKMARISGLDYATATDYMTNAIRSFKMEMSDAQKVVDVYSAVAASSATDTSELATAMSKTASSAEAVGSSFENTTAMMAVMIEATRESAENIGSAMKSIISRYGEMTSDPNAITDSEGEAMSLNRVDKALQTVGITIHDTAGQFRDFDDVIMELAQKWDTIDTNTQRYIATIMA